MRRGISFFILMSALCVLFLAPLGRRDLWEPDEPRHALMCQEVVNDGVKLFATYDGEHMPEYGPLYFWMGGLFGYLGGGEETTVTAILPSTLSALAILLFLYFLGKELGGRRLGFLSAAVLASMPNFFYQAQTALIDMVLALGIAASMFFFYRMHARGDRSWLAHGLLLGAMGFSWLAKGPVSGVLVALSILTFFAFKQDWAALKSWTFRLAIFGLILSVLWFGSAAVFVSADYFWDLFWKQTIGRFMPVDLQVWMGKVFHLPLDEAYLRAAKPIHPQPFYYYLVNLPGQLLPWLLFLPFSWISKNRSWKSDERFIFPAAWFVATFVFFSAASGKRRDYLLPLFPAVALLVARGLDELLNLSLDHVYHKIASWIFGVLCFLLGVAIAIAPFILKDRYPEYAELIAGFVYWAAPLCLLGPFFFFRGRLVIGFAFVFVLIPLLMATLCTRVFPIMNPDRSWKPFVEKIVAQIPPDSTRTIYYESYRESFRWFGGKNFHYRMRSNDPVQIRAWAKESPPKTLLIAPTRKISEIADIVGRARLLLEDTVKDREYRVYLLD